MSSAHGGTKGQDMGNAFLQHLIGKPTAEIIRHFVELGYRAEEDDEFAEYYGLLEDYSVLQNNLQSRVSKKISKSAVSQALV
jgi:hypothetical protein